MLKSERLILVLCLCLASFFSAAHGQIKIRVTEGTFEPLRAAIPQFIGETAEEKALAKKISDVIEADLVSSGLFKSLDKKSFIQQDLDINVQPFYADWRVIDADALIIGEVEILPDGKFGLFMYLYDVYGENYVQMGGKDFFSQKISQNSWRRMAHIAADSVYTALTGEEGYFDTRIVYIAESGPKSHRKKRLALMDQDGSNPIFLTSGNDTVLTPRFSPTRQIITYMSYEGGRPRVFLYDIETGRREVLGNFPGMTFAPRFTTDGNGVIMSLAKNGNSDIYLMDLRNRSLNRLTSSSAIDTSPSMAPDGKRIVFNSDRGGSPQLYVTNANGNSMRCPQSGTQKACRISFGKGRYSTPVWSPRGDLIAFTKQRGGKFYIGVMKPDGTGERLLTEAYLDEGPTWSPNGRVIMFFRETRPGASPALWSVDLTGRNLKKVRTSTDASDPAWSPPLTNYRRR